MRIRNKILPALALIGLALAVAAAMSARQKPPVAQPVAQPAQAPFASYIGGGGIVEAQTDNISIGSPLAGVTAEVFVEPGQSVRLGDPLFRLDDREAKAALTVKRAAVASTRAALEEAKASLADYQAQYDLVKNVTDRRAVSVDDAQKRKYAWVLAKAKLESAKAAVDAARADMEAASVTLDRLTVRAPVDGEILQVNIRPGEFAATGVLSTPLIRMGTMDNPHIRADIDENDAWRFKRGARAMAFLRGNRSISAPLRFVRVEPYVTPKTSLTGSSNERVDTRVLQVIYAFDRDALPIYVGQQVDVFIEAPAEMDPAEPAPAQENNRDGNAKSVQAPGQSAGKTPHPAADRLQASGQSPARPSDEEGAK
ncbi:hypothetical protein JCM15519_20430 [Fundidesulfovibrio butyratiphilus]